MFRIVASIDDKDEELKSVVTKLAHAIHRIIIEQSLEYDDKIEQLCDLSILEFSVIIAIKHHSDIYDREPFNFEIILNRLHKFQNSIQTTKEKYDRAVVLKSFDVLLVSDAYNINFWINFTLNHIISPVFRLNHTRRCWIICQRIKGIQNVQTATSKPTNYQGCCTVQESADSYLSMGTK